MKICMKCEKQHDRTSKFCSPKCTVNGYLRTCNNCKNEFRGKYNSDYCSRNCYFKSEKFKDFIKKNPVNNPRKEKKERLCKYCNEIKTFEQFREVNKNLDKGVKARGGWNAVDGSKRYTYCKSCECQRQKDKRDERPAKRLWLVRRRYSLKNKIPFDITIEDIENIWPKDNKCPITKKIFKSGIENKFDLPTLEKIIPEKGYVMAI